jgi:hypothetical protein
VKPRPLTDAAARFRETIMTDLSGLDAALAELRRKAAKRRDNAGYGANVILLEQRIAALEAQRAAVLARDGGA